MTAAYAPRHAVTAPRASRTPLWQRARRVLLGLLPARTVTFTDEELYAAAQARAAADRFACCECCATGAPCDPRDNHRAPCADGCNDPAPVTLARRRPIAGRAPWPVTPTAELSVLTDAATLAMYRGDWGTRPAADVLEGERLAGVMLP